jgi:hypothetical protein
MVAVAMGELDFFMGVLLYMLTKKIQLSIQHHTEADRVESFAWIRLASIAVDGDWGYWMTWCVCGIASLSTRSLTRTYWYVRTYRQHALSMGVYEYARPALVVWIDPPRVSKFDRLIILHKMEPLTLAFWSME